ncbi:response regulator [Candidatus Parcubacteria bacterium]|nr:MAG: response regulator [Candidatus Parcubacteria bacterium]
MARVLVVDDNAGVRNMLVDLISMNGHDVTQAADGIAALEMLRTNPLPNLLVTDGSMPRMDGIELARRARRLGVLKILMVTGDSHIYRDGALAAGVDRVIEKPVDFAELSRTVAELLI